MNVYQIVTEKIISMLESGTVPWKQPWMAVRPAHSKVSGKPYSLINQILLSETGPGAYATYDQWIKLGGRVRRGSKAGTILFYKMVQKETDGEKKIQFPILRYFHVFHESQVEGIEPELYEQQTQCAEPIEAAERLLTGYIEREGVSVIEELSNRAYYDPRDDLIHLPSKAQFTNSAHFYSVYAHEGVHSTGRSGRLDRKGLQNISFGSAIYSEEELVAEIGSAYLLASLGIDTKDTITNSVAYIKNWMCAIKNDDHMIVRAASAAERAVDYIRGVNR